jgi:hypothetical protein
MYFAVVDKDKSTFEFLVYYVLPLVDVRVNDHALPHSHLKHAHVDLV